MEAVKISLEQIRSVLPDYADVSFIKYRGKSPAILIKCRPSLSEAEHSRVIDLHKEMIGRENIWEFYTEETGRHWYIFLNGKKLIEVEI